MPRLTPASWLQSMVLIAVGLSLMVTVSTVEAQVLKGGVTHEVDSSAPGIVGMNLEIRAGHPVTVLSVYANTPAQRAGIKPGDKIVAINHWPTVGLSKDEVDEAIPDTPGEPVHFMVFRNGRTYQVTCLVQSLDEVSNNQVHQLFSR